MRTRLVEVVLAAALIAAGVRWIWNSNAWSGPTIMRLTHSHGVHLNDWLSFVLWGLGAMLLVGGRVSPVFAVVRRSRVGR